MITTIIKHCNFVSAINTIINIFHKKQEKNEYLKKLYFLCKTTLTSLSEKTPPKSYHLLISMTCKRQYVMTTAPQMLIIANLLFCETYFWSMLSQRFTWSPHAVWYSTTSSYVGLSFSFNNTYLYPHLREAMCSGTLNSPCTKNCL